VSQLKILVELQRAAQLPDRAVILIAGSRPINARNGDHRQQFIQRGATHLTLSRRIDHAPEVARQWWAVDVWARSIARRNPQPS
jgi:hypothetical protein